MKRKCTPINNAITIKTPVTCPAPIAPIVDGCVDPFTYTWNMAVNQALLDSTFSVGEYFDRILDKGLMASSATNVCCPDCIENPIYVLASVESFLKLADFMGWLNDDTNQPCCTNIQASIETYLKYNDAWQVDQPECCKTDFESCLNQFSTIVNLDRMIDKGIVEANGFDGNTLLCKIYELFVNTPEDLLQGATLSDIFDRILDKGFVAYCCDCNVIIGSIETFLKWWDATGGCGTVALPAPAPALG